MRVVQGIDKSRASLWSVRRPSSPSRQVLCVQQCFLSESVLAGFPIWQCHAESDRPNSRQVSVIRKARTERNILQGQCQSHTCATAHKVKYAEPKYHEVTETSMISTFMRTTTGSISRMRFSLLLRVHRYHIAKTNQITCPAQGRYSFVSEVPAPQHIPHLFTECSLLSRGNSVHVLGSRSAYPNAGSVLSQHKACIDATLISGLQSPVHPA